MKDGYWLPPRKAWLCRLVGVAFLTVAAATIPVIALDGLTPGPSPECSAEGCIWPSRPVTLIDGEERAKVEASPAARRAFEAYTAKTSVRPGFAGIAAIAGLTFAMLVMSVGIALRRLGGHGTDSLPRAISWLRRASLAAIAWTLTQTFHDTLLDWWLSAGTPSGPAIRPTLYLDQIAIGLLLALAAYAAIWAIEAGLRAQRDLDDFV